MRHAPKQLLIYGRSNKIIHSNNSTKLGQTYTYYIPLGAYKSRNCKKHVCNLPTLVTEDVTTCN